MEGVPFCILSFKGRLFSVFFKVWVTFKSMPVMTIFLGPLWSKRKSSSLAGTLLLGSHLHSIWTFSHSEESQCTWAHANCLHLQEQMSKSQQVLSWTCFMEESFFMPFLHSCHKPLTAFSMLFLVIVGIDAFFQLSTRSWTTGWIISVQGMLLHVFPWSCSWVSLLNKILFKTSPLVGRTFWGRREGKPITLCSFDRKEWAILDDVRWKGSSAYIDNLIVPVKTEDSMP